MRLNLHHAISSRHLLAAVFALGLVLITLPFVPASAAQAPAGGSKQAVVTVEGMQCPFCAYGIRKHLAKLPGARKVEVELAKNQAIVTFAPDAKVGDKEIQQAIRNAGFTAGKIQWRTGGQPGASAKATASSGMREAEQQTATFAIDGMRCVGCEAKITADLEEVPGVTLAQVDWQTGVATVRYDPTKATPDQLTRAIERAGKFQATLKTSER